MERKLGESLVSWFFPLFFLYTVVNYSFGRQHVMGLTLFRVPQTAFH